MPDSPRPTLAPLAVDANDAAHLIGVSRATWWRMHSAGRVPLPVRLATRTPRWRVDELREWLLAGAPNRATWNAQREQEGRR